MSEKLKTIKIKDKDYVQVNDRVKAFRNGQEWQGWAIVTHIHELTDDVCVMCAEILNASGVCIATGWAREVRNDAASMVNKTSYVENCETSAVGRALGFLGIGIDENICSAQELVFALQAQNGQGALNDIPAAPVEKRGGAIYPAKEPEKPKAQKLSDEQLDEIYNNLTERELTEYSTACAQMNSVTSREQLNAVYGRYKDAAFAPLLLEHGMKIKAEKGW